MAHFERLNDIDHFAACLFMVQFESLLMTRACLLID